MNSGASSNLSEPEEDKQPPMLQRCAQWRCSLPSSGALTTMLLCGSATAAEAPIGQLPARPSSSSQRKTCNKASTRSWLLFALVVVNTVFNCLLTAAMHSTVHCPHSTLSLSFFAALPTVDSDTTAVNGSILRLLYWVAVCSLLVSGAIHWLYAFWAHNEYVHVLLAFRYVGWGNLTQFYQLRTSFHQLKNNGANDKNAHLRTIDAVPSPLPTLDDSLAETQSLSKVREDDDDNDNEDVIVNVTDVIDFDTSSSKAVISSLPTAVTSDRGFGSDALNQMQQSTTGAVFGTAIMPHKMHQRLPLTVNTQSRMDLMSRTMDESRWDMLKIKKKDLKKFMCANCGGLLVDCESKDTRLGKLGTVPSKWKEYVKVICCLFLKGLLHATYVLTFVEAIIGGVATEPKNNPIFVAPLKEVTTAIGTDDSSAGVCQCAHRSEEDYARSMTKVSNSLLDLCRIHAYFQSTAFFLISTLLTAMAALYSADSGSTESSSQSSIAFERCIVAISGMSSLICVVLFTVMHELQRYEPIYSVGFVKALSRDPATDSRSSDKHLAATSSRTVVSSEMGSEESESRQFFIYPRQCRVALFPTGNALIDSQTADCRRLQSKCRRPFNGSNMNDDILALFVNHIVNDGDIVSETRSRSDGQKEAMTLLSAAVGSETHSESLKEANSAICAKESSEERNTSTLQWSNVWQLAGVLLSDMIVRVFGLTLVLLFAFDWNVTHHSSSFKHRRQVPSLRHSGVLVACVVLQLVAALLSCALSAVSSHKHGFVHWWDQKLTKDKFLTYQLVHPLSVVFDIEPFLAFVVRNVVWYFSLLLICSLSGVSVSLMLRPCLCPPKVANCDVANDPRTRADDDCDFEADNGSENIDGSAKREQRAAFNSETDDWFVARIVGSFRKLSTFGKRSVLDYALRYAVAVVCAVLCLSSLLFDATNTRAAVDTEKSRTQVNAFGAEKALVLAIAVLLVVGMSLANLCTLVRVADSTLFRVEAGWLQRKRREGWLLTANGYWQFDTSVAICRAIETQLNEDVSSHLRKPKTAFAERSAAEVRPTDLSILGAEKQKQSSFAKESAQCKLGEPKKARQTEASEPLTGSSVLGAGHSPVSYKLSAEHSEAVAYKRLRVASFDSVDTLERRTPSAQLGNVCFNEDLSLLC